MKHEAFLEEAHRWFAKWKSRSRMVVLLSGPMGAGKTEFVRACVGADAVSPSFALQQVYQVGREIQHWDLFRLEGADEIEGTGFWDQFDVDSYFVFIEWPEKLKTLSLPRNADTASLRIEVDGDLRRLHVQTHLK